MEVKIFWYIPLRSKGAMHRAFGVHFTPSTSAHSSSTKVVHSFFDRSIQHQGIKAQDTPFNILINILFYTGHILSHKGEYDKAVNSYNEAEEILQNINIKKIFHNNPAELLVLQARCHLYKRNFYRITDNKIQEEQQQDEYKSKSIEILYTYGIKHDAYLEDHQLYPLELAMDMINNDVLKPSPIAFTCRTIREIIL